MKNFELLAALDGVWQPVFVVNPAIDGSDHAIYEITKVTGFATGEPDTVIEVSGDVSVPTLTATSVLVDASRYEREGDVQVFVKGWEGQEFAYFSVREFRKDSGHVSLILGDWLCGG